MKTRIIYPSLWDNESVLDLSKDGKVLLFYLHTNSSLGLIPYVKLSDRKVLFETGLKKDELDKARGELIACSIHYFDGWYFLNREIAYVDYEGRDRVIAAKQKELGAVPQEVLTYFEQIIKGLKTGLEPVLNPKSKTINPKTTARVKKTLHDYNDEEVNDDVCAYVAEFYGVSIESVKNVRTRLKNYCASKAKRYADYKATLMNWVSSGVEEGKIKKVAQITRTPAVYLEPHERADVRTVEEVRKDLETKGIIRRSV